MPEGSGAFRLGRPFFDSISSFHFFPRLVRFIEKLHEAIELAIPLGPAIAQPFFGGAQALRNVGHHVFDSSRATKLTEALLVLLDQAGVAASQSGQVAPVMKRATRFFIRALWLVATSIALILIRELFEGLSGVHVAARPAVIASEQTHTPPV